MLKTAVLLTVPEDQTQRQAFEKLMPHLYVLRNKGCSWGQLAKLLSQCGFRLQPSTVRSYFSEMLAARMDICQARMNEQIAILAAIRKETAGADLTKISSRVTTFMSRLQETAESRVDAMFGLPSSGNIIDTAPSLRQSAAAPPLPQQPVSDVPRQLPAPKPELPQSSESDDESSDNPGGDFGLLRLGPAQISSSGPSFFSIDSEQASHAPNPIPLVAPPATPGVKQPAVRAQQPNPLQQTATTIARPSTQVSTFPVASSPKGSTRKRIGPLQGGVPPLKQRRPNVPDEVYDDATKLLEHPAIPDLMLNLEQRLYGAALEYWDEEGDEAGSIKVETPTEKRFRVTWRQTVPMTQTRTTDSFTQMDQSLFPTKPTS